MTYKYLNLKISGNFAEIEICRPQSLNALNMALVHELYSAVSELDDNPQIILVKIVGSGEKAFVAGADISEMQTLGQAEITAFTRVGHSLMSRIECSPKIYLAAIRGYALGGGLELALACDLIVASSDSFLGVPEVTLGLIPGFGGTQRLQLRAGVGVQRRWVLTGRKFSAAEAQADGVVDYVFESDKFSEQVSKLVETILQNGQQALSLAKRTIYQASTLVLQPGLEIERQNFIVAHQSEEAKVRMKNFCDRSAKGKK